MAVLVAGALGCRTRHDVPTPEVSSGSAEPVVVPTTIAPPPTISPPTIAPATRPVYPPGTYMGRRLATTMSHIGAPWLTRDTRASEENPKRLMAALALLPGQTACDLGAGNGYHTLMMAAAVAPTGRAIAADLQPKMLALLQGRAKAANITNIEVVLSDANDSKLPTAGCDVVLMADVYHELSDPAAVLAQLQRVLKPTGTIALVEFRAEDPEVPVKELHKMSKAQILREYQANGFTLVRSVDDLPWQHLMFFAVAASQQAGH
jgi:predicted methyltransferase